MSALSENRSVRQRPDEGFRRWFVNEYFDLIVWYESRHSELTGFQLCYSRHNNERAFTWQRGKQGSHFVSSGADQKGMPGIATAVLHGDAGPVPEEVLDRLASEQGDLDNDLLELVTARAREYNRRAS
tara:strand:- start:581 stop:964 length:384 start_codon:yes stop_codon:yes gene_type:complete